MRITESRLRQLIREALLAEAALTPRDVVNAGITLEASVLDDEIDITARLVTPENPNNIVGGLNALKVESMDDGGPCSGAYAVTWVRADVEGLGPLLYDLAIDLVHPFPLTSDRSEVSSAARSVWNYYDTQRPDIESLQLDDLENTLTPKESDNCPQWSAAWGSSSSAWSKSPLSRAFRRRGRWTRPTLNALQALDAITLTRR